jgi:hypothetical protein
MEREWSVERELAKLDAATLENMERLLEEKTPPTRTLESLLEEREPEGLQAPIQPNAYQPIPPPRRKKKKKGREIMRLFDPLGNIRAERIESYQKELEGLYEDYEKEGIEEKSGRRYTMWRITRGLEGNLTQNFMEKIRQNVTTSYYMRYSFCVEIEDRSLLGNGNRILFRQPPTGSQ